MSWLLSSVLGSSTPRPPSEQDLTIEKLMVYPLKSCTGVAVKEAVLTERGLELDRNWIIVDLDKEKQLSARDGRGIKLVLVKVEILEDANAKYGGTLKVSFPDPEFPTFHMPLRPTVEDVKGWRSVGDFDLFGSSLFALVVPPIEPGAPDPSEVLSSFTGHEVKVGMLPPAGYKSRFPGPFRPLNMFGQLVDNEKLRYDGGVQTAFADLGPIMIASTASLEDARAKIEEAGKKGDIDKWDSSILDSVRMERWRPNWIVSGVESPFGEDEWQEGEVGDDRVPFVFPLRTPRCMFPNVDPGTAIRHPHVPHKVMMKYRKVEPVFQNKYCFGVYGIPVTGTGVVKVGDRIRVTKYRKV